MPGLDTETNNTGTDTNLQATAKYSNDALTLGALDKLEDDPIVIVPPRRIPWRRAALMTLVIAGLILGAYFISHSNRNAAKKQLQSELTSQSSHIKRQTVSLPALGKKLGARSTQHATVLSVNGQLNVSNSIVLQPSMQPNTNSSAAGQLYFNQTTGSMYYFNGTQYVAFAGLNTGISGSPGSIAAFNASNTLGSSLLTETGSMVTLAGNLTLQGGTLSAGSGAFGVSANGNVSTSGNGKFQNGLTVGSTAEFSVDGAGAVTAVGVNSGVGLLQGMNGLAISGATSLSGGSLTVDTAGNIATVGTGSFQNGVTVGAAGSSVGNLYLANASSNRLVGIQALNPSGSGNATIQVPTTAGGTTDTICLLNLANCSFGNVNTGGGIQNYVSKFTGAGGTQLGTSEIYDTGTGVSIGGTLITGLFNIGSNAQFNVSGTGAVSAVGVNSGSGLLQGTGGLTVSGGTTSLTVNGTGVAVKTGTNSATALLVQNAAGKNNLAENTSTGALTLGNVTNTAGSGVAGSFVLADGTNDNYGATIDTTALSGNETYQLPTGAAGTNTYQICTTFSVCNGYTAVPVTGSYLEQIPTSTAINTVTPTASDTVGLTVNGTSGAAAAQALVVNQAHGADAVDINVTGSSQNNGLFINSTSAGTLTNGLNIANTSGTITNGLTFTGNFATNLINAQNFTVSNTGAVTAVGVNSGTGLLQGTGGLTLTGTTQINATGSATTTIGSTTNTTTNSLLLQGEGITDTVTGSASAPSDVVKTSTNATTAFQVQNSAGGSVLNTDTSNDRVGVDVSFTAMASPIGLTVAAAGSGSGALSSGTTYYYKVTAIDASGGETSPSSESSAAATATGIINIYWTAVTGAVGYNIYRATASGSEAYLTTVLSNYSSASPFQDTGSFTTTATTPPVMTTAYTSATTSNNLGQISIGGNGSPTSQLYVSGSVPNAATGSVATGTTPEGIYVQNNYAYVANYGANTLQIFDVSNPMDPTSVGSISTGAGSGPKAIVVKGKYAYVTDTNSGTIQVFNVSNPASPSSVDTVSTGYGSNPYGLYVQGNYLFVVTYATNTLLAYNISNPAVVTQAGSLSMSGNCYGIYVQGIYAYVTVNGGSVAIVNVSNPASMTSAGSIADAGGPKGIYVQGSYAYVANNSSNTLQIINISNPGSPTTASTISTGGTTGPQGLYVQGKYAYLANLSTNTLQIFDVSDPYNPQVVGTVNTASGLYGVFIEGNYAYVTNNTTNSLQAFNLGGAYIQQLQTGDIQTSTLQTAGDAAIAGDLSLQGGLSVGGNQQLTGNLGVNGNETLQGTLSIAGGVQGGMIVNALATPSAPTVTAEGTTGAAQYSYVIQAVSASGGTTQVSGVGTTSTGNATLSASNYNLITWNPVPGAVSYNVFYGNPANNAPHLIGNTTSTMLEDTGLAQTSILLVQTDSSGQLSENGNATFKGTVNNGAAFQVQNSTGANLINVDSIDNNVDIGSNAAPATVMVSGGEDLIGSHTINGLLSNEVIDTMTTPPRGTLSGSAYYDPVNQDVSFNSGTYSSGDLGYSLNPGNYWTATWQINDVSAGADSQWFYFGATTTPQHEFDNIGGYLVYYDEHLGTIELQHNGSNLQSVSQTITTGSWTTLQVVRAGTNLSVYYNGALEFTYSTLGSASGPLLGWGARSGGVTNTHLARSFVLSPSLPTPTITPKGTTGSSNYSYDITAISTSGGQTTASPAGSTATGNATLTAGNYNQITWTSVTGATSYDIYRSAVPGGSGLGTGLIGTANNTTFNDTGVTSSGSVTAPPTTDTSGQLDVNGIATLQNNTNTSSALQVNNASGANLFNVNSNTNTTTINSGVAPQLGTNASGNWNTTTAPPSAIANVGVVEANGYIYTVGGNSPSVRYDSINDDGTLGSTWSTANSLPHSLFSGQVFVANNYIYVIGGSYGGSVNNEVLYAQINPNGSLGTWQSSSNTLPTGLEYTSGGVANGYAYVVGGLNGSASAVNTVYYAKVLSSGGVGPWTTNATTINSASGAYNGSVLIANGYIYYFGGYLGAGSYYYAQLNANGSTGSWTKVATGTNLYQYNMSFEADGTVYVLGGWNGSSYVSTIVEAPLGSGGTLGSWTTASSSLPVGTGATQIAMDNGYAYLVGGNGSSTNSYYISLPRTEIAGSLDLVGLNGGGNDVLSSSGSQSGGSAAGTLAAGNTTIVGTLQVQDAANFNQSLGINGSLTASSDATFADTTNSTNAFQVQNASGANLINIDTSTDPNLLPENASNFETGQGWTAKGTGSTVTQSNTASLSGSYSLLTTTSGTANAGAQYSYTLAPSTAYEFSIYSHTNGGTSFSTLTMGRQEQSGTDIDCVTALYVSNAGWYRESCSFTTGATISSSNIYIKDTGTNHNIFIDDVQLAQSGNAQPYAVNLGGQIDLNGVIGGGPVQLQNASNSNTAFAVYNASGSNVLDVDTNSGRLEIGTANCGTDLCFGGTANRAISIGPNGAGAGKNLTVVAGAGSSGNAGGNLILQGGANGTANSASGSVIVQANGGDGSGVFQVQDTMGINEFQVGSVSNNYITDSDFTLASSGNLTDWSAVGAPTLTQNTTVANTYEGNTSAKLVTSGASQGLSTSTFSSSPPTAAAGVGEYYTVSFYIENGNGGSYLTSNLQVTATGGGNPTCTPTEANSQVGFNQVGFSWLTCNLTFTSAGSISALSITDTSATAATLYIDDVQLQQAAAANSAPAAYQIGTSQLRGVITSPVAIQGTSNSTTALMVQNTSNTPVFSVDTLDNTVGIDELASNGATLAVNGVIQSSSLQITSGSGVNNLSKNYNVGTGGVGINNVVVLANDSGNSHVIDTTTSHDTRVMGVSASTSASGSVAPIVIGGNCQVTADTGAVNVGDQLVTSSTSGEVTADDNATTGILGYATSSKASGSSGLVNVYVHPVGGVNTPVVPGTITLSGTSGTNVTPGTSTITATGPGAGSLSTETLVTGQASNQGLVLQGASGQTANLLTNLDANGVAISYINANGGYNGSGTLTTIGALQRPSTPTITTGTSGTSYYYVVTATNAQGETIASNAVGLTSDNGITIAWTQVTGATGYKVYRNTSNSFTSGSLLVQTITNGSTTTFSDSNDASGAGFPPTSQTQLSLSVTSESGNAMTVNGYGNVAAFDGLNVTGQTGVSGSSQTAGLIVKQVSGVPGETIMGTGSSNALQFQDINNGDNLAGFSSAADFTSYGTNDSHLDLAAPSTPTITTGTSGTSYYYVVTATNAQGETIASNAVGLTSDNGITIAWTQVTGATGYKVYRNTSNSFTSGSLLVQTITNGSTTTFSDSNDASGAGLPPTAPIGTGLTLQGWSGQTTNILTNEDANGVTLSDIDANGNLNGFGTTTKIGSLKTPAFTTSPTGTNYYYVITATNTQQETLPSASIGMANDTSTLNWTQITGATGYRIYRNTSNSFTSGSLLLATLTNGSTTGYADTGSATTSGLPPTVINNINTLVVANENGANSVTVNAYGATTLLNGLAVTGQYGIATIQLTQVSGAVGQFIKGTGSANAFQFEDNNGNTLAGYSSAADYTSYGTNTSYLNLAVPSTPTITTGTSGTNYYYVVTATNAQGETQASNAVGLTSNSGITIGWTQVPGATGYKVYRNTTNSFTSGSLLVSTITNGSTTTFSDSNNSPGAGIPPTSPIGTVVTLQGWNNQSQDLFQLMNASGSEVAGFTKGGNLKVASFVDTYSATGLSIGNSNATSISIGNTTSNIQTTILGSTVVKPTSGNDSTTAFQIQNAGGGTLFNVDSTTATITISGTLAVNGHIVSGGTAPSVAADAAANCGGTASASVSGNDSSGTITVSTGTGGSCSAGDIATLTFNSAYGSAPRVLLSPNSSAAAALIPYVDGSSISTTQFAIGSNAATTSTSYTFNYWVIQ